MHEVGCRVVRGPDWSWGNQDNGEGHVGTVVEIGRPGSSSSPDKTVVVQWDMGSRTNYRIGYQNSYDLRLFDNAPAGVRHPNVICDGCKDHGISGMLWKCAQCFDFDLCTMCYMNDTHELSHPFRRFDTASSVGVDLEPRLNSPKIVSRGIFAGARVARGPDWDWGNQDGGDGKVGRVVDIRGWDNESGRSVANVIWSSGSTNVYRLGHKGKVDLKCVQSSSAGSYYVNHLAVLGMPSSTIQSRSSIANASSGSSSSSSKPSTLTRNQPSFNVSEKVQVVVQDISRLKEMQEGHGGWNPRMAEFIGKIGSVHRVTDKGDIRVQYDNNIRWTFNPAVVTKVTTFSVGDVIQVINDCNKVKELQKGHGEWVEVMKDILGKNGTIIKVYGDSDLRVNFGNCVWTMNPLAVRLVPCDRFESNNSMYANANRRDELMSQDPMLSMLPQLLNAGDSGNGSGIGGLDISGPGYSLERFVREAAQGRTEVFKKMLPKMKDRINHKSSGKTPLQVAAHQGHLEIVVLLLANGAHLDVADDEGDSPLHFAAFGNQPMVMELLLKAGASINAVNRGQCTPLHVSVNKQFLDCVKTLMKYKCNVNIQDSFGDTSLHDGIGKDSREIIDCLISTPGIDFTLRNNRGFNVLHHAALKGNYYAVERILAKARQLADVKKDDGFSALHLATLNGHYSVAKSLVEDGQAEIEILNNRKQTPLHLAVSQGYCGIVEYLISKGARPSPEDEDGDSPLHVILTKHFDGKSGDSSSHGSSVLNPVTSMELKKLDNAPTIAAIWDNLITNGWSPTEDPYFGGIALACFMAQAGGDLNKRNRRGITPLDLCRTERLKEILAYYSAQIMRLRSLRLADGPDDGIAVPPHFASGAAVVPGAGQRNSHSHPEAAASTSAPNSSLPPVRGECLMCSETLELIIFEPCLHRSVCEECCVRMKKCINCKEPIERKVTINGRLISISSNAHTQSNSTKSTTPNPNAERLKFLETKFAEIEEAFCCSICMERRRNVVFLCGHGACDKCSEALNICHMCRNPISQKVNIY